jgi:hypothetical protein
MLFGSGGRAEGDPENSKNKSVLLKSCMLLPIQNFCSCRGLPNLSRQTSYKVVGNGREIESYTSKIEPRLTRPVDCFTSAEKSREPAAGDSFWTDPIGQDLPPRAGAFLSKERSAMSRPAAVMAESRVSLARLVVFSGCARLVIWGLRRFGEFPHQRMFLIKESGPAH